MTYFMTTNVPVAFVIAATSNDPVIFGSHKLGQTDHKGHRDLWGHKLGHGNL